MYVHSGIRAAALVHARLLDRFTALVMTEIDQAAEESVRDSLLEMLDHLREQRREYGIVAGPQLVRVAA